MDIWKSIEIFILYEIFFEGCQNINVSVTCYSTFYIVNTADLQKQFVDSLDLIESVISVKNYLFNIHIYSAKRKGMPIIIRIFAML